MACIVEENQYIDLVALDHNGNPLFWTLSEGEEVVDIAPPVLRSEHSRGGILKPVLSDGVWIEGATAEELAAWDAEHPVLKPEPTPFEKLRADVDFLMVLGGVFK